MDLILSDWKAGASYTKGLSQDEYFYEQILEALKFNLNNNNLPFFNNEIKNEPRELVSGKVINDENLIALEQVAAKKGYNSNLWIYGADLERFEKEGIKIRFQKNAEPVLCMTKFKNPIHIDSKELYINEGGSKNNFQFLYNFDSLTPETKNKLIKYQEKINKINEISSSENFKTFSDNLKNKNNQITLKMKERIKENRFLSGVDCSSVIEAQYMHNVYQAVGAKMINPLKEERVQKCYTAFNQLFEQINSGKVKSSIIAQSLTKKLYMAAEYQRTMTSKNMNMETSKIRDENLKKASSYGMEM